MMFRHTRQTTAHASLNTIFTFEYMPLHALCGVGTVPQKSVQGHVLLELIDLVLSLHEGEVTRLEHFSQISGCTLLFRKKSMMFRHAWHTIYHTSLNNYLHLDAEFIYIKLSVKELRSKIPYK